MASYKYAVANSEKQARVVSMNQNVSSKQCIEIGRWLKGRKTAQAKSMLEAVQDYTIAVPYRKFVKKMGHRKGPNATGRYPQKASKLFLKLINEVEANAEVKGLDKNNLEISAIVVNRGAGNMHQGRQRGRQFKNSHIELVVVPAKQTKKEKVAKTKQKIATPAAKPVAEQKVEAQPKAEEKPAEAKQEAQPATSEEKKLEAPKAEEKKPEAAPSPSPKQTKEKSE